MGSFEYFKAERHFIDRVVGPISHQFWMQYGLIALVLFLRVAIRIRTQGIRRLAGNDYLTFLAFVRNVACLLEFD